MRDDTRFHAWPEHAGYAHYDIDLVSAEAPSGAAWLVNCLLELGIPAWKPWGSDDRADWQHVDGCRYRYVGGDNGWSRVLPALRHGREFAFRAGSCVRAHHAWPDLFPPHARRLMFVRDPRDALYSAWRRQQRLGAIPAQQTFVAFCASRFFHYPLSWADYLLLFLRVWRQAADREPLKIVRFEDYRANARATLQDVAAHLGIDVAVQALDDAIARSSVERAKDEDARLVRAGVVDVPIVRGAPPGEYARELDLVTQLQIGTRYAAECEWLRYPVVRAPTPARRAHSQAEVHAAVLAAFGQAGIPVDAGGWLASAVYDALAGIDLLPTSAQ